MSQEGSVAPQDLLKRNNLLHKHGFVDSKMKTNVNSMVLIFHLICSLYLFVQQGRSNMILSGQPNSGKIYQHRPLSTFSFKTLLISSKFLFEKVAMEKKYWVLEKY